MQQSSLANSSKTTPFGLTVEEREALKKVSTMHLSSRGRCIETLVRNMATPGELVKRYEELVRR